MKRRTFSLATVLLSGLTLNAPVAAQDTRLIRVVVPYPAGGIADAIARLVIEPLAKATGQTFIVENKAGAGGNIGATVAAQSKPDGSILLFASSFLTISPGLYTNLKWDAQHSFEPITLLCEIPNLIVVRSSVPAKTIPEFVKYAQSKPEKVNYASGGAGSLIHLAMELFQRESGVQFVHVPYKGQPEALNGLLGGETEIMALTYSMAKPLIESGRIRALAIASTSRSSSLQELPTMIESGFQDFEASTWFGLMAPRGTEPAHLAALDAQLQKIMKDPDLVVKLQKLGAQLNVQSGDKFRAFINADLKRWSAVIQSAGIKLN